VQGPWYSLRGCVEWGRKGRAKKSRDNREKEPWDKIVGEKVRDENRGRG